MPALQKMTRIPITLRYFLLFLGASVFLLVSSGIADAKNRADGNARNKLERVSIQLKWKHQFQFAGYYAALEKGYYRDAGLDVELIPGSPGKRPVTEVVEGRADYGVGNSEILLHFLQGQPLVALAVIFQHSPSIFLARGDSGILSPQDMVGKRVMMREGIDSAELLAVLRDEGISLDSIQKLDISYDIRDLIEGRTDVYHSYITDQPYYLEQNNIPVSIIRPITYGIDFYGDTLFTSQREVQKHPERVRALRDASLRGWEYAMDHPDEMIELILAKYKPDKTKGHLQYEAESMRELLYYEARAMRKLLHPELIELGHMNPGRWRHIAQTFARLGMVDSGYSLDGFMYNPNPEPDYTWVRWVACLATVSALIIAALLIFNRRLQRAVNERTLELTKLNHELEQHQLQLEEKIAARTQDLKKSNQDLQEALDKVKKLSGLLPICASCKKIRDDNGYWKQIESYIREHSDADFSHSICPECAKTLYPHLKSNE